MIDELRKQFLKYKPDKVERRNGMLIFDLVTKYCLFSETLGALINGFESSNQHAQSIKWIVLVLLLVPQSF